MTTEPAYPPTLDTHYLGNVLDAKVIYSHDTYELGFEHKGGGDVVVTLFDDGLEVTTALVHLTGEGQ